MSMDNNSKKFRIKRIQEMMSKIKKWVSFEEVVVINLIAHKKKNENLYLLGKQGALQKK